MKTLKSSNQPHSNVAQKVELVLQLSKRDISNRFKGSALGWLWLVIVPITSLLAYSFVFGEIFKSKWPGSGDSKTEFAILLFAGLIAFNIFGDCASRAPSLILSNPNFVKKIVFPIELLPVVSLLSAIFVGAISILILLVARTALVGSPPITALLTPLILLPLIFWTLGVNWLLSALGTYFRDLQQTVSILVSLLMFLSPVFYPITAIPERFKFLFSLNPLAQPIEALRGAIHFGTLPNWSHLGLSLISSIGFSLLALWVFWKLKPGFADVV